jgi:hypothetical protein
MHQDSLQRIYEGQFDDRYIDPVDGRVKELVVYTYHHSMHCFRIVTISYPTLIWRQVLPLRSIYEIVRDSWAG